MFFFFLKQKTTTIFPLPVLGTNQSGGSTSVARSKHQSCGKINMLQPNQTDPSQKVNKLTILQ